MSGSQYSPNSRVKQAMARVLDAIHKDPEKAEAVSLLLELEEEEPGFGREVAKRLAEEGRCKREGRRIFFEAMANVGGDNHE